LIYQTIKSKVLSV